MSGTARSGHPGWICTGCAKIVSSQPFGRCHDCNGFFREATAEDYLCDRCGDCDGKRLLDRSGDYDRLCEPCIQALDLRTRRSWDTESPTDRWTGALERYPKGPDDSDLPAEMELLQTEDGMKWVFREIGLRVEVDGEEFVPDSVAPTDGYVVLRKKGSRDGMIDGGDDREVRIYADMASDLLAVGAETDVTGGGR